jgi:hypothetical protein
VLFTPCCVPHVMIMLVSIFPSFLLSLQLSLPPLYFFFCFSPLLLSTLTPLSQKHHFPSPFPPKLSVCGGKDPSFCSIITISHPSLIDRSQNPIDTDTSTLTLFFPTSLLLLLQQLLQLFVVLLLLLYYTNINIIIIIIIIYPFVSLFSLCIYKKRKTPQQCP